MILTQLSLDKSHNGCHDIYDMTPFECRDILSLVKFVTFQRTCVTKMNVHIRLFFELASVFNANIPKKLLAGLLSRPVADATRNSLTHPDPASRLCCPQLTRPSLASGFTRHNLTPLLIRHHPL